MQDRISLYPGRVKMTPVAGQENTYDMERADSPTQAGTPLSKANLLKDATAALYGLGTDAVPDSLFATLSKSVLAEVSEKYTKHVVALGGLPTGYTITLNVDGTPHDFIVIHQGKPSSLYDDSCNGTWLLMKDIYESRAWNNSNVNSYKDSTIHSYLNSTFLNLFDADVKTQIKTVKIPYVNGTGYSGSVASGSSGLSTQIFLLSGYEVGWTTSTNQYYPIDGAKLDYFESGTDTSANNKRIARLNGSAAFWWLRSPLKSLTTDPISVSAGGATNNASCASAYGIRPALILPSDSGEYIFYTDSDGNVYSQQEYETMLTDVLGNLISIPAEQVKGGIQIATGSYVGTGTYGSANPCSLTFDFVPKLVFISGANPDSPSTIRQSGFITSISGLCAPSYNDSYNYVYGLFASVSGNTITWYTRSKSEGNQLNYNLYNYECIAIG